MVILLIDKANSDSTIIAKKGDTLFKISNEYGISLKELMHKNNFNDATKLVEGEVILIPKIKNNNKDKPRITYKIKEGDTLYKIAQNYSIELEDIININGLNDSSYLKVGQIIMLPDQSSEYSKKQSFPRARHKVNYHQISEGERVEDISKIHNIPIEDILSFNQINNKEDLNIGSKLQIREDAKELNKSWLDYGPLKVQWSDWTYVNGNYFTTAKNKKKTSFFFAINCEKRRINHTLKNGLWGIWFFANNDFEHQLINDFCDQEIKL